MSQQVSISSLCAVFAESEVITLIAKGMRREVIATALHNSIVTRILPLVKRVGLVEDIVFAGGCARDACLKRMLIGALGASMFLFTTTLTCSARMVQRSALSIRVR